MTGSQPGSSGSKPAQHDLVEAEASKLLSTSPDTQNYGTKATIAPPLAAKTHKPQISTSSNAPLLPSVAEQGGEHPQAPGQKHHSAGRSADLVSKINDRWWWEIFGAALGVFVVGCITAVLAARNGKKEPDWPFDIKLTGLAAGLSTIAKAASLLAVTTAISQLKWLWYRGDPRKLADIELYDSASRGPWGSLVLMWKLRAWSFVYLGTIIVLVSTLFEVAVQSAITTGVRTIFLPSKDVRVSRIRSSETESPAFNGDWKSRLNDPLGRAATTGLIAGSGYPNLKPTCPSDSCTWPTFSSLGICSRCLDLTEKVKAGQRCHSNGTNLQCTIELEAQSPIDVVFDYIGNGPGTYENVSFYNGGQSVGWYNPPRFWGKDIWAGIWYPLQSFQNFEYMVTHLKDEREDFTLLSAQECAVYTCVKTYNVSIMSGIAHQDVLSEWHNDSTQDPTYGTAMPPLYLFPPKTTNDSHFAGPFMISGADQGAISNSIGGQFKGMIAVDNAFNIAIRGDSGNVGWIYSQGNVSQTLSNVALALTDRIQTSLSSEPVLGEMSVSEQYVRVRWGWLALPIALTVLSVVFLLMTIYTTKKNKVSIWKSSTYPLLYHGLAVPPAEENYPLDQLSQMSRLAETTESRLRRDQTMAWKFIPSAQTK